MAENKPIFSDGAPVSADPTPAPLLASFTSLQAKLAGLYYGQWSPTLPLVVGSPFSADQIAQINDCIKDGLMMVYSAHEWSFLRQVVSITTSDGTGEYAMPNYFDSIEGPFTYPAGIGWAYTAIQVVREVDIRKLLSRDTTYAPPRYAAVVNAPFYPDFSPGSLRRVMFYPTPDAAYVLSAVMTMRPTMIDADNLYPLGAEVLSPVIHEAVLASAEKNLEEAPGVHTQTFQALLAAAITRDQQYSTPDTLGVGQDPERPDSWDRFYRPLGTILLNGELLP
jgi:hypothetical protein